MAEVLLWLLFMLSLPWVVFMAMKLGTYAFFRGRQLFYEEEEEKTNGER